MSSFAAILAAAALVRSHLTPCPRNRGKASCAISTEPWHRSRTDLSPLIGLYMLPTLSESLDLSFIEGALLAAVAKPMRMRRSRPSSNGGMHIERPTNLAAPKARQRTLAELVR